jgi:hypothetical protein
MARITVLPNGVTASCPRYGPLSVEPVKRGAVGGWSIQATRRLRRWLYSVDGEALTGQGYAMTLTVRDLPATPAEWAAARRAFLERLRREGLLRYQWLTEFQMRRVPHLHGMVFFPEASVGLAERVVEHWLAAAAPWRPAARSQSVTPVWGLPGWLQYQAKHSARGVRHYQRANVPEAWESGTGRLWGAGGEWPLRESPLEVDMATFHRMRRGMRSYLLSGARAEQDWRRVGWCRRMLSDPERARSSVRAVGEFCPESVSWGLLHAAITPSVIEGE